MLLLAVDRLHQLHTELADTEHQGLVRGTAVVSSVSVWGWHSHCKPWECWCGWTRTWEIFFLVRGCFLRWVCVTRNCSSTSNPTQMSEISATAPTRAVHKCAAP